MHTSLLGVRYARDAEVEDVCTFTEAVGRFSIYEVREKVCLRVVHRQSIIRNRKLQVVLASVCLSFTPVPSSLFSSLRRDVLVAFSLFAPPLLVLSDAYFPLFFFLSVRQASTSAALFLVKKKKISMKVAYEHSHYGYRTFNCISSILLVQRVVFGYRV